jgi:hypothetical protein
MTVLPLIGIAVSILLAIGLFSFLAQNEAVGARALQIRGT